MSNSEFSKKLVERNLENSKIISRLEDESGRLKNDNDSLEKIIHHYELNLAALSKDAEDLLNEYQRQEEEIESLNEQLHKSNSWLIVTSISTIMLLSLICIAIWLLSTN